MSGIYIHSTNAINAILRSGYFRGTNKQMQNLGMSAEEFAEQFPRVQLHTLFVEWRKGNVAESVSRIANAKGDIRGVLILKDPKGIMNEYGGYPAVVGAKVCLTDLSLRGIVAAEEDMKNKQMTLEDLRRLVRPYAGRTFAFDIENIAKIKDGKHISEFLLSATNSGAFY